MIGLPDGIKTPVVRFGSTNYTLSGAVPDYDIDALDYDMFTSVINGDRELLSRGKYFGGKITVFGVTRTTMALYRSMAGTVVRLWPFGAGSITGSSPARYYPYVDVIVVSCVPFHDAQKYYMDACVLTIASQKYYELQEAVDIGYSGT